MKIGTSTSSIDRFVARVTRRVVLAEAKPWPRLAKFAIWIGMAAASWGLFFLLGYFIWADL